MDNSTGERQALFPDKSFSGARVARELDTVIDRRGRPGSMVSLDGIEVTSTAHSEMVRGEPGRVAFHRAK